MAPGPYLTPGVYIEEPDTGPKPIQGVATAIAAFVGFTEKGDPGRPIFITNWTQFTDTFGGFKKGTPGSYLQHAVYGYFNNGGSACYVTKLPGDVIPAPVVGPPPVSAVSLPGRIQGALPTLKAEPLELSGQEIQLEVRPPDAGTPDDQFTLLIRRGQTEERFDNVSLGAGPGARHVVEVVNRESKLVRLAELQLAGSLTERTPAVGTYTLTPASPASTALVKVDPAAIIGEAADRTGVNGYEAADDVTMICIPDLMAAYLAQRISEEDVRVVQTALLNHCENMQDRVAILDPLPNRKPQEISEWRRNMAGYDSKYGALYYPWIKVFDSGSGKNIFVPPCGHMAGIWARSDSERGVHKAPANEVVRGAIALGWDVSGGKEDSPNASEQGNLLNQYGINCIRTFPGRGIRVWGARTLSSDTSWQYLNVRRLFNYVEKSIERGTQWVVFEPNDMDLWERVKRDIRAFLTGVWRDGALFGATPQQSFYVKCDEELNPQDVRDRGELIVEIGLAPVKPAEFVIFRISQYAAASGVSE